MERFCYHGDILLSWGHFVIMGKLSWGRFVIKGRFCYNSEALLSWEGFYHGEVLSWEGFVIIGRFPRTKLTRHSGAIKFSRCAVV